MSGHSDNKNEDFAISHHMLLATQSSSLPWSKRKHPESCFLTPCRPLSKRKWHHTVELTRGSLKLPRVSVSSAAGLRQGPSPWECIPECHWPQCIPECHWPSSTTSCSGHHKRTAGHPNKLWWQFTEVSEDLAELGLLIFSVVSPQGSHKKPCSLHFWIFFSPETSFEMSLLRTWISTKNWFFWRPGWQKWRQEMRGFPTVFSYFMRTKKFL